MGNIKTFLANIFSHIACREIYYFVLLVIVIFLESRYLLFKSVYDNFAHTMGSEGDSYYNLSLFMQNTVNNQLGNFFSLTGDHFTWYPNIIGLTAHVFAPSLVFQFLYQFIKNPILIYNILFFGNIFLTQVGIYFLVKYYTRNFSISIISALIVPLSSAVVWTFYVGHIHAALYWSLPFAILFFERIFDSSKKRSLVRIFEYCALFVFLFWLYFSEWHIAVFSSIWIGIWILLNCLNIFRKRKTFKEQIIIVITQFLILGILLGSVGYNYLSVSKHYRVTRTIDAVTATNFETAEFFGLKNMLIPITKLYEEFGPEGEIKSNIPQLLKSFEDSDSAYPDKLSTISFWIGLLIMLPWLCILIKRKGNYYVKEFILFLTFFISSLIALGPYPKAANHSLHSFKLPHYYIYQLILPFSAIRAVWRSMAVGYLALVTVFGIFLNNLSSKISSSLNSFFKPDISVSNRIKWKLSKIYLFCFGLILFLVLWQGATGSAYKAFGKDDFLHSVFETISKEDNVTIFLWSPNYDDSYLNYQTSLFNLEKGKRSVNWVVGGIAGTYPRESTVIGKMVKDGIYSELIEEVLHKKNVNYIIFEKLYDQKTFEEIKKILLAHYRLIDENNTFQIWKHTDEYLINNDCYSRNLYTSSWQEVGTDFEIILNVENNTKEVCVNNSPANTVDSYIIEIIQSEKVIYEFTISIGTKPFLLPNMGFSYVEHLSPKIVPGEAEARLYLDRTPHKKILDSKNVIFLDSNEYKKKVDNEKNKELSLEYNKENKLPYYYFVGEVLPVKLSFQINSGIIANKNLDKYNKSFTKLISSYFDGDEEYNGFPGWLNQPVYVLSGNYFAKDQIEIWEDQFLPYESRFNIIEVKINSER